MFPLFTHGKIVNWCPGMYTYTIKQNNIAYSVLPHITQMYTFYLTSVNWQDKFEKLKIEEDLRVENLMVSSTACGITMWLRPKESNLSRNCLEHLK